MSYAEDRYLMPQTRGGRRPGSGRKKRHNIGLTLRIPKEACAKLKQLSAATGTTPGQLIAQLLSKI
jgi:hypothetical protein